MIAIGEAFELLASVTGPIGVECIALTEALGRVLARDVVSDVDWPPFDTSAMDGYAVRLSDVAPPERVLRARDSVVTAGDSTPPPLEAGEALRVMTGAPIPQGTQAIVPVELARVADGGVLFERPPMAGAHIRRRGESLSAGSRLLPAGRRLAPADIALAALAGAQPVEVFRRPRVTVVPTGNELVASAEKPGPGKLRDSNGPMIAALCREAGCPATLASPLPDEAAQVERLFARAGEVEDVLLSCGGVSAGDLDLLPGIAAASGFEILFHGVAIRPGKPVAFGRRRKILWFGLPGNPVSSAVGFHLFVRFALGRLEGSTVPAPPRVQARLARALRTSGSRESYRDARLFAAGGELVVEPVPTRGSHDIAAHARANALLRLREGSTELEAGTLVECVVIGQIESREQAEASGNR